MVWFVGEAQAVGVMHSRLFTGRPTCDNATMSIRFKSGAFGSVFASFCVDDCKPYPANLTFNFERGTIRRTLTELRLDARYQDKSVELCVPAPKSNSSDYPWETLHRALGGEKIVQDITPEQVVAAIRIIRAMARSEQSGQVENV